MIRVFHVVFVDRTLHWFNYGFEKVDIFHIFRNDRKTLPTAE